FCTIPVPPKMGRKRRERSPDPRYVEGQRLLVEAMKYLTQADPVSNRGAIELISEHVRTRFRMTDSPLGERAMLAMLVIPPGAPFTTVGYTKDTPGSGMSPACHYLARIPQPQPHASWLPFDI